MSLLTSLIRASTQFQQAMEKRQTPQQLRKPRLARPSPKL